MNRSNWIRLERWYLSLNVVQQWLVKILSVIFIICCIVLVTHEPSERKQVSKIILNCDHCGSDPERTMTYNEYMDQKEHSQHVWFRQEKQRIRQEIWDERGRQRWCREHPQDRNCQ